VYRAIREATLTTARREDFRIVHLSIQHNHVHLIVEASDKHALASGMKGFQISAAKHLNAAISEGRPGPRRRGTVFPDRYHGAGVHTSVSLQAGAVVRTSMSPQATSKRPGNDLSAKTVVAPRRLEKIGAISCREVPSSGRR
jgi:hypothetical protein